MTPSSTHHYSFVLRMWLEKNSEDLITPIWRCALLDLHNEQRLGFSTSAALFDYLQGQITQQQGKAEFGGRNAECGIADH